MTATHHAAPRGEGDREALRILLVAREHANTTRTAAVNVFKALVLTAPDQLRESLRHNTTPRQTAACLVLRTHARHSTSERILRQTLRAWRNRFACWTKRSGPTSANFTSSSPV